MDNEIANIETIKCIKCNADNLPNNKYCNKCGKKIIIDLFEFQKDKIFDNSIRLIIIIYFIMLLVLFINHYKSDKVDIHPITWDIIWGSVFIVFTSVFTYLNWKNIKPIVSMTKLNLKICFGVVVISIVWAFFVFHYVDLIHRTFNVAIEKETIKFYGFTSNEYLFVYLIFTNALVPGITEELIMRGVLYNYLKNVVNEKSVIYVTAFLFTITHFNLISATWIIFNGIFYGFLRYKTNNLLYSIIGHTTHNIVVSFLMIYY
ncbi:MAG: hypothetical protein CO022_09630 [Flavobacteriales bacterium CG_4_9_14_0_2_um_filter_32_27]|nr:MAG: hypothetical protein CO022_09630 [Flavobacteriales bacterium CG_4_9_14_0_2_um_filter_32_27]